VTSRSVSLENFLRNPSVYHGQTIYSDEHTSHLNDGLTWDDIPLFKQIDEHFSDSDYNPWDDFFDVITGRVVGELGEELWEAAIQTPEIEGLP